MLRISNENIVDFDIEGVALEAMQSKIERVKKLKRIYEKIDKNEIDEAHKLLNEGAEKYIDIDLMTEENKRMVENGIENTTIASFICSKFPGLIFHNDDFFIYLTIKTDDEGYIEEITEKYLFSAELINNAIQYSKSEEAYYKSIGY